MQCVVRVNSWYGSAELKRDVVAQVRAHHQDAVLAPVKARDWSVDLYGWPNGPDLDAIRAAVGIDKRVLALGLDPGGTPENEAGIRYIVGEVLAFIEAVPVGVELSWVPAEVAARRLVDPENGLITIIDDTHAQRLLEQVAEALRHGLDDELPVDGVRAALAEWNAEIPRQWQADGIVEFRVYAHVRALTSALHACAVPREITAAGMVINTSLYHGISLPVSAGTHESVREAFLALLRDA